MPDLLDPLAGAGYAETVLGDAAWLAAMVEVEVELIHALVAEQLVPAWMAKVADDLRGAQLDLGAIAAQSRSGGNPVIPLVAVLGHRANANHEGAADHLHLGATSQDILDSAAMVVAREVIRQTSEHLTDTISVLCRLAEQHRGTPMAGRTLGQHASPITFGLVVAGWLDGLVDARNRLIAVGEHLPVQYGGAVGTRAVLTEIARSRRPDAEPGAVVANVVERFSRGLDLQNSDPWHSNRNSIVELGSALGSVVGALGSMAIDINILSRTEIAELSEGLRVNEGGSSAMPHKRNPVTPVLLISAARRSPGLVGTLFGAQVAEDQRPSGAWHSEWQALRELERLAIETSSSAADLIERLHVDAVRMRSNLDITDGLIYSERVTTVLAESIGKSAAFELVGRASRESLQTSRPLQVVVSAMMVASHDAHARARVLDAFDPNYGLEAARIIVDKSLARAKELP